MITDTRGQGPILSVAPGCEHEEATERALRARRGMLLDAVQNGGIAGPITSVFEEIAELDIALEEA